LAFNKAIKNMIWLVAVGCLAVGIVIGVVLASRMNTSPSRVQELENQIRSLKESHGEYRDNVSDHFSMTAELVQHMTQSYREVYQHLATGAQDLCPSEVASKLLPTDTDAAFETTPIEEETSGLNPPKDYATKQDPQRKGALSEDFGLDKSKPTSDEDQ
jgi:uncharacterized membrane-anchored protein YhcB (DUF1043 family)